MLVRGEQLRVALALRDRHGHDLVLEAAGRDGGLGLLLGGGGELVEFLAGQVPLVADVLRGQAHVDVVHGAVQAVVDHHVDHAGGRHVHAVAEAGLRQGVGRGAHVLHAAGDDDVRVAALDGLGGHGHGLETAAANLVDGHRRHLLRDAGLEHGLAGRVLAQGAGEHAAEDHLVDHLRLDARPLQGLPDDQRAELHRRDILQGTAEFADRCPAGANKNHFTHSLLPRH